MELDKYIGKEMIAWNTVNKDKGREDSSESTNIYVFPRYFKSGDVYKGIDSKSFPSKGSIQVRLKDGLTSKEVIKKMGHLVSVRMNQPCYRYDSRKNQYFMDYSTKKGKVDSPIWVDKLEGNEFYQIFDTTENIKDLLDKKYITQPTELSCIEEILVKKDGILFGPFQYKLLDEKFNLLGLKDNDYIIGSYEFDSLSNEIFSIKNDDKKEVVFLLPKNQLQMPKNCEVTYDWITSDKLIDVFINALKNNGVNSEKQLSESKNNLKQLLETKNNNVHLSKERFDKIKELLSSLDADCEYITTLMKYFLKDDELKTKLIEETVENNFELIEKKLLENSKVMDHIKKLNTEVLGLDETKSDKKIGKKTLTEHNKPNSKESKVNELDVLKNVYEELQKKLTTVSAENKQLSDKLNRIEKTKYNIKNLKRIEAITEAETKKIKDGYEQQIIIKSEMKKELNKIIQEYNNQAKTIAKTFDKDMLGRVLRVANGDKIEEETIKNTFDKTHLNDNMSSLEIIERVKKYIINIANRRVTTNDVVNYLICISQGSITTFTGKPGTGKTSLCNIIAKSLGLVSNLPSQKRFVDVSVERGWSSPKDFIGYYSSLTKTMEKSNAEVFDALNLLNSECEEDNTAPYFILLDDANLSPIEHYWAPFLRNCDSTSNASLSLGGNETWQIPKHLKFLATVNFDHTTEELSPRFIDRSWVISLNPSSINEYARECNMCSDINTKYDVVSYSSLKRAFSPIVGDVIDAAITNKWNSIRAIYKKNSFQIMPRNLIMVHNYCLVACKEMRCDTPSTKFSPIDYAFSEKILPLINGTGIEYKNLINELLKVCSAQDMPMSNKHLLRIKDFAENNMGYYQFFSK